MNFTVDVGDIRFSDIVIGNDGGEGKEEQRDSDKVIAKARHHTFHRRLHIAGTCRDARNTGIKRSAVNALDQEAPDGYVYVQVETGVSDDSYIEITSGLQEGDTVAYLRAASSESGSMMMGGMPGNMGGGMSGGGGMPSGGGPGGGGPGGGF